MQYIRDVFRLVGEDLAYRELGDQIMEYAQLWMRFVFEKCERGRGQRPRSDGRGARGSNFLAMFKCYLPFSKQGPKPSHLHSKILKIPSVFSLHCDSLRCAMFKVERLALIVRLLQKTVNNL